jgi:ferredoxin
MQVFVDMERCQSHGSCTYVAPAVFELGEDDVLRYEPDPDPSLRERVEEAVLVCPAQAIRLLGA